MEESDGFSGGNLSQPPRRLFERLTQLSGYSWDQSVEPFHSVSSQSGPGRPSTNDYHNRLTITGTSLEFSMALEKHQPPLHRVDFRDPILPKALHGYLPTQVSGITTQAAIIQLSFHRQRRNRRGHMFRWLPASQPTFSVLNVNITSTNPSFRPPIQTAIIRYDP